MRYAQLVIGPAGSGKSTYCSTIVRHCENIGRTVHVINLDPAAEYFDYPVLLDTRELVQVEDVMEAEDLKLGPNGGLVFCMEYLIKNMDWLEEQLGYTDEDYFIFDCPGRLTTYVRASFVNHRFLGHVCLDMVLLIKVIIPDLQFKCHPPGRLYDVIWYS